MDGAERNIHKAAEDHRTRQRETLLGLAAFFPPWLCTKIEKAAMATMKSLSFLGKLFNMYKVETKLKIGAEKVCEPSFDSNSGIIGYASPSCQIRRQDHLY